MCCGKLTYYIYILVYGLIVGVLPQQSFAGDNSKNCYNVPIANNKNVLFFINRSINKNTVVYELNKDKNGNLIEEEPIKVYWINIEENNKKEPLTLIQRNFSYGIESEKIDKNTFKINFVGYSKRHFYLKKSDIDNQYHVYANLNDTKAILNRIFINIDGGTFWFPNITYVSVEGEIEQTGNKVKEIIKP